jgi:hypothetical protein
MPDRAQRVLTIRWRAAYLIQGTRRCPRVPLCGGAGLLIGLAAVGLCLGVWPSGVPEASAHDNWIARGPYRSPHDGSHCCGENDCFPVHEDDITITAEGYRLTSGEHVPFEEAHVSEDGSYWRCMNPDRSRRCFFAPRGGV